MKILVLNCGSSSVKYQLFDMPQGLCLVKGVIEKVKNHERSIRQVLKNLAHSQHGVISSVKEIATVGHRIVHGGEKFSGSTLINKRVIKVIEDCLELAPLHNYPNLIGIKACQRLLPNLAQVAVFDTAFHQTMPDYAYLYALPYNLYKKYKVRRYGFHGTSHRYVSRTAARILKKPFNRLKIITCHLGNGCSITAVNKAKSMDTSMGFTPLEGLVMGTRSGDVDPAAVLYIMKKEKLSIGKTIELLNKSSGLLGLSGISNDMRDIEKAIKRGNKRAKLAREIFIYRIKKYISAYVGIMHGCDTLVFTAGIGENAKHIREKIVKGLQALIERFKIKVLVIPTDEEKLIAEDTYRIISRK